MILTFLGTSAANAYPEAFCQCIICNRARELGGPSLRKRSAAIINEDLLIDLGPDIMTASAIHNRPLTRVRYCLQTHGHADHLDASHLMSRSPEFGVIGAPKLHFYASAATAQRAAYILDRNCAPYSFFDDEIGERLNLKIYLIEPLQSFSIGKYQVIAFSANISQWSPFFLLLLPMGIPSFTEPIRPHLPRKPGRCSTDANWSSIW